MLQEGERQRVTGPSPDAEGFRLVFQGLDTTGIPRSQETAFSQDPIVGLCLGPYGGPRGGAVFNEQGTPVTEAW